MTRESIKTSAGSSRHIRQRIHRVCESTDDGEKHRICVAETIKSTKALFAVDVFKRVRYDA
jgi:hypothetical protein